MQLLILIATNNNEVLTMSQEKPPLDPHPLSEYVAWAGSRNREPLLGVLKEKLPKDPGNVLELASGSGMHINYFAPHFEHLHFQPSDKDKEVFDNIKKLSTDHSNDNIADPAHLDLTDAETWFNAGNENSFAAIFCINIFQVAPISIADGMMECASLLLKKDGILLIYGPFQVEGTFTTDSNKEFHETLGSAGVSEWGLKDVADLKKAAERHGLELKEQINMPANNFSLIFGRK
jgi:AraC-like DNA-binding protein